MCCRRILCLAVTCLTTVLVLLVSAASHAKTPAIGAGAAFGVGIKTDGTVQTWGDDRRGQLGDGGPIVKGRPFPARVAGLTGVVAASGGIFHAVALKGDGTVWAWGENTYGQLGDGTFADRQTAAPVIGLTGVVAIAAGTWHTVALKADGTVWAWGSNPVGALGDGTFADRSTPVRVGSLTGVVAIAAGTDTTWALKSDGSVWGLGANDYGQLGDGTSISRQAPVQVSGLTGVIAVSAGILHTIALKGDGTVWAWGYNKEGELGDGTTTNRPTPVQVTGLTDVIAISAGGSHSVVLKRDGSVWAWGWNNYGQLGDGTRADRWTPVAVSGLTGTAAIAAGGQFTLALKADGGVQTWGQNIYGQLGDGTFAWRSSPVVVLHENGSGSVQGNDWYLDLDPSIATTIPPGNIPAFAIVASGSVPESVTGSVQATADIQYRPEDVGSTGSVYVFALAPAALVKNAAVNGKHLGPVTNATAKDSPLACVLAQLTSSGQLTAASSGNLQAYLTGVLSNQGASINVLNGISTALIQGSVFYVGYGSSSTSMINGGTNRSVVTIPGAQKCEPQAPQTGWWWNKNEGGRGFSIETQGNHLFMAGYFYESSGRATWMISGGSTSQDGSLYNGTLLSYANGQTLTGAYQKPGDPVSGGAITLSFTDARSGTLIWPGGAIPIERFDSQLPAGSGAQPAFAPENGWWWNKDESGRGYFLEFKNSFAFIAGYMYDASGNPLWYIAKNTMASPQTFQGSWEQYANGQSMTGAYKPATQISANVGPLAIQFQDASNATMTLQNGTKLPVTRFRF
jgi:alpha-tubulin suppressor-like RCC1 family protein